MTPQPAEIEDRQEASPSSARAPRASPPRSSSRARATTCTSTRRTRVPAGCSSTAFPTSRWRSTSSRAGRRRWRRKASSSTATSPSAATSRRRELEEKHDAVLLAMGSETPFDFFAKSPGRDLDGIHYAMDFLTQQNRRVAGEPQLPGTKEISAKGKHVDRHRRRRYRIGLHRHVVPAGREVGHAARDHAEAAGRENKALSWPNWPLKLRDVLLAGRRRRASNIPFRRRASRARAARSRSCTTCRWTARCAGTRDSDATLDADLVLFAMGFSGPTDGGVLSGPRARRGRARPLQGRRCQRARLQASGQWQAVRGGRRSPRAVARRVGDPRGPPGRSSIDKFLMGKTTLPR